MKIVTSTNRRAVADLLSATRIRDRATEARAAAIVARGRRGGGAIEVPGGQGAAMARRAPPAVRAAIKRAAGHIRKVARKQVPAGWRLKLAPGIVVEQRVVPLGRVGCYVPAGRYPLPSSLLMTAVPARAAGGREVVVACPRPDAAVF